MPAFLSPPSSEVWPRWLPAPNLWDRHTHLAESLTSAGLCGAETMWTRPDHPATRRPHCPDCERPAS